MKDVRALVGEHVFDLADVNTVAVVDRYAVVQREVRDRWSQIVHAFTVSRSVGGAGVATG